MPVNSAMNHYERPGLLARIDAALAAQGRDSRQLNPTDLATLDQFHSGGKAATLALASMGHLTAADKVLDVGGGLGGPARLLASEIGCDVTVLDLTHEYINVGRELTRRCRLESKVSHVQGDALSLPFPDTSFSVVWTQHSSMNVPDKPRLYSEIARVLKPNGRYLMHEVFSGRVEPIAYPAPWASRSEFSHMIDPDVARRLLASCGWIEQAWNDTTADATQWFSQRLSAIQSNAGSRLGIGTLLGETLNVAFDNQLRNLQEGRIVVAEAVWMKPETV